MSAEPSASRLFSFSLSKLAVVILLAGVVPRLYHLASAGLWYDEGCSYLLARFPLPELFSLIKNSYFAPPLWYLICKVPVTLLPAHAWVVRLPAVIPSILAIYGLYLWMKNQSGEGPALIASGLLAISPLAVFFAQEGRNYSLLSFLYLVAIVCTQHFIKTAHRCALYLVIISNILILFLHDIGGALWFGMNCYYFLEARESPRHTRKTWLIGQSIILGSFLLWLPIFYLHMQMLKKVEPIAAFWQETFWLDAVYQSIRNMVPGDFSPKSHLPLPYLFEFSWVLSVALLIAFLLALRFCRKKEILPMMAATFAPLICIALYSTLISPAYWIGRTEILVLPVFCALSGYIFHHLKPVSLRFATLSLLLFGGLWSLTIYHFSTDYPRKQWDMAAAKSFLNKVDKGNPSLLILDIDNRVSVAAHVAAWQGKTEVMVYPDSLPENPSASDSSQWAFRFFQLKGKKKWTLKQQNLAAQKMEDYLDKKSPSQIGIIYSAMGTESELIRNPYIDSLLIGLQKKGWVMRNQPQVFPMDWHKAGYHVVMLVDRLKPAPFSP